MEIELCPNLQHPFTCLVSGMTQSGKSEWVHRLLHSDRIEPKPDRIIYCYSEPPKFNRYDREKITFHRGLPSQELVDSFQSNINNLLVFDDLMQEIDGKEGGKMISSLFTRGSHHKNLSIVLIVQNLFHQNKHFRTISLNSSYLVVFKTPRDSAQIEHLARQMFPKRSDVVRDAYSKATSRPHGYLLIDLKQSTPDVARLRTNIFKGEGDGCEVFVPI